MQVVLSGYIDIYIYINYRFIVSSGYSVILFWFVQTKTLCMYGCMYFFAALVLVCVDVMVMSSV